jgi:hypothetical protein
MANETPALCVSILWPFGRDNVPGPRDRRALKDTGSRHGYQVQDTLDGELLAPVAVKPTVAVAPGAREPS